MLSVIYKNFMISVIMLHVVVRSVVAPVRKLARKIVVRRFLNTHQGLQP
jgi:hypothetical protein